MTFEVVEKYFYGIFISYLGGQDAEDEDARARRDRDRQDVTLRLCAGANRLIAFASGAWMSVSPEQSTAKVCRRSASRRVRQ
jgi:hypothetical protein